MKVRLAAGMDWVAAFAIMYVPLEKNICIIKIT